MQSSGSFRPKGPLQKDEKSLRVAVLDTIHGAGTIAGKMEEMGIEAEALEVYHHTPRIEGFDLVCAPVHLPPSNPALSEARRLGKKAITHHRAVGEILRPDARVYEVTGTHSKTSTALILAKILSSRWRVVSHTTRGIELWSQGSSSVVATGLSITPGNVIRAVDAAEDAKADALICEVSLGGTGLSDVGIVTSLSGDYMIAGKTLWASTAKLQMLSLAKPRSVLVANTDARLSADITFGDGGAVDADPLRLQTGDNSSPLRLGEEVDFPSYRTAICAAAAAARASGIGVEEIASALEGFDGLPGRMKITRSAGMTVYDLSNSGLKVPDVARALDKAGSGICLVAGEESETVCEGMDVPRLISLIRERRGDISRLILVGERLHKYAPALGAEEALDLSSGAEMAMAGRPGKLLLSVKCFR